MSEISPIEAKIKDEVMKLAYGSINELYDYMDQHFDLEREHQEIIIRQLNRLKEQFYLIAENSRIS